MGWRNKGSGTGSSNEHRQERADAGSAGGAPAVPVTRSPGGGELRVGWLKLLAKVKPYVWLFRMRRRTKSLGEPRLRGSHQVSILSDCRDSRGHLNSAVGGL